MNNIAVGVIGEAAWIRLDFFRGLSGIYRRVREAGVAALLCGWLMLLAFVTTLRQGYLQLGAPLLPGRPADFFRLLLSCRL